jgi:ABC-type multidrug transport system fused ATPase/permease subunit
MAKRLLNELRTIRTLLPGNYWRLAFGWVLGLVGVGLMVVLPQQMARLTNLFSGDQPPGWGKVHTAIFYLVASQLALSVVIYWRRKTDVVLQEVMVRNLTLMVFSRVLRFSADFFRDHEAERINTRALEDTERVATLWAEAVFTVPLAFLSIVVFAILMLADNWFLGACMIPLSLLSCCFLFFDSRIQALNARGVETRESVRAQGNQVIVAAAELRQHFAFDYGLASMRRCFQDYRQLMIDMGKLAGWFQALAPVVATIQIGVLTWLGAALCLGEPSPLAFAGRLTWGDIIAFMLLLQLFQKPVTDITGFVLRWRMTRENIRRVEEFLERPRAFEPSGQEPTLLPGPVGLQFDHVSVRASSGATILSGVELQVPPGTHIALAGPAGCGKSTAIQLILREFTPSDGRIALNARAVADYHLESVARTLGFVPQTPVLLNTSIRNNLLLGLRRPSSRALKDAEGPLDISRLESVQGLADLDRELLRVVHLVDLEADILRKCLDNRLPAAREASSFRTSIVELRKALADRLQGATPDDLVPFDVGHYLPGPLADNLVWVGLGESEPVSAVAAQVLESLSGEPLLEQLLEFGRAQILSDHALRVRSAARAPDLQVLLPSRPSALDGVAALTERKHVPLAALPRTLLLILLEVALKGDSFAAQKMFGKEDFTGRVLAARKLMEAKNPGWRGCWKSVEPGEYVPQLTVRENLLRGRVDLRLLGAAERVDAAIQDVLAAAGLLERALLTGLEFVVGEGGKYLSGGQRQKVALARALLKNPSVLLLDEATAALDELSQARITKMIRHDFAGRTVVAISHRLSTIRHCDQIVVLDRGQVSQQGTYEELASQQGIFRELVRQEQGKDPQPGQTPEGSPVAAAQMRGAAELRQQLARCPLFAHLNSDNLAFLERLAKEVRCARGQVLFRQGDPGSQFFFILEGEVDFFFEHGSGDSQQREVISTYGPGASFGELALFGAGRRTLGAVARTDLHLCVLERDDLLRLIEADPHIAIAMLQVIATREAAKTLQVYQGNHKV